MTERSVNFSGMQRLMLAGQALETDSALYNMAFRFDLRGLLDSERFAAAVSKVVAQNECLRIRTNLGELSGYIDDAPFSLPIIDASDWSKEYLQKTLKTRTCTALDLSKGCFDSTLYQLSSSHHVWFVMKHHIATDGAAFSALQRQVVAAYQNETITAPSLEQWLTDEQAAASKDKHITNTEYWACKSELSASAREKTPITKARNSISLRRTQQLDDKLMAALDQACEHAGVRSISRDLSRFSLLAATLLTLRFRLFDNEDTTLGVPFAKRAPADLVAPSLEIGFLNVEIRPNSKFLELAQQILQDTMRSMKHISPGVSNSKTNASFSWLLNMVNSQFASFDNIECESHWLHPDAGDAAHTLRLQVHDFDRNGRLNLHFDMSDRLFDSAVQENIPAWFVSILSQAVNNLDIHIADLDLLSSRESEHLKVFNDTERSIPENGIIDKLRQFSVEQPQSVAISCGKEQLSYQQLQHRVDDLAAALPDRQPLPILLPRSTDYVVAVLAALTRRTPFVPLDIEHPDDRLHKILKALGSPVVLTDSDNSGRLQGHSNTLLIDTQGARAAGHDDPSQAEPEDAAYIIFTSGTTGQPKGVEVTFRSLNNYLHWASEYYGNGRPIRMPLFSSVAFDLTLTSLLLPIFTGGAMRIYLQSDQSSQLAVLDVFADDAVDIVKLTPSHLRLVLQSSHKMGADSSITGLILGGEDFRRQLAISTLDRLGEHLTLYNEYGPTEATIGCMIHKFDPGLDLHRSVPIGTPINNARVHLLDACDREVPTGVKGRMFLDGDVLASTYWKGPPIRGTLYATGDQAIRQPDGNLVYLGRLGGQRKFRGARIELEEIEAIASNSGLIDDVVVRIATENSEKGTTLCAKCGIASNVPGVRVLADGTCSVCKDFDNKRASLEPYFKTLDELQNALRSRTTAEHEADCLAMVSGGKDSSYMLCKLVEMGFRPVVFTLDNGYLSEHALANVERMCIRLGLHWERQCPKDMDAIFADSLRRHSNVCNGCFKTIYTLAINYALAHQIPSIITGLSRGQLFETRLLDMVDADVLDEVQIDQRVDAARKAYHLIDDKVSECLDVSQVRSEQTFQKIKFFDFYRYTDVVLSEMYTFLQDYGDWQRPPDTGRSTNCLINDVGIYVHQRERKYHNYAVPYAWDVRMGHKTRAEAVDELNDDIDLIRVKDMLNQIDYTPRQTDEQLTESLVAYYVATDDATELSVRESMASQLPDYAMPTHFIRLEHMPLSRSGKLNESALPKPSAARQSNLQRSNGLQQTPLSNIEKTLATIWRQHFNMDFIGLDEDFFALGGDSILAVQISASCKDAGLTVVPTDLFSSPTLRQLAMLDIKTELIDEPQASTRGSLPNTGLAADELSDLLGRF